jgi:polyferredoxin
LHWKRLKVVGYGVALLGMTGLLAYSIGTSSDFEQAVIQVRQPLFVVLSDGDIRNRYQVRVSNKSKSDETYLLDTRGLPAGAADFGNFHEVTVKSGKSLMVQVSVKLSPDVATQVGEFAFTITPKSHPSEAHVSRARFYTHKDTQ